MKGLFQTCRNLFHLLRLAPLQGVSHFQQLKERLKGRHLGPFLEDYELIFEVNLLSTQALASLERLLHRYPSVSLADLLQADLFPELPYLDEVPKNLVGNSLDLQDASPFTARVQVHSAPQIKQWWKGLSEFQKKLIKKPLKRALTYSRLREYARWLLVRHTNQLRPKNKRKPTYSSQTRLPTVLSSVPLQNSSVLRCLSTGEARGKLISLEAVKKEEKGILFTTLLTPDLVQHFPQLKGILSQEGGLLSHLAIMAREQGIPVISGFKLGEFQLGDELFLSAKDLKISSLSH